LTAAVATYLRTKKTVPVALVTPYGATPTHFVAVSSDAKLTASGVTRGSVGHDRIQMARAGQSIGEAIRDWFRLPEGLDFERIEVDISIQDDCFYLVPLGCKFVGKPKPFLIQKPDWPLSFHGDFQSRLWKRQLETVRVSSPKEFKWAILEIDRVVAAHLRGKASNILESDLLRAAGALSVLGMKLGPYLGKGFDCKESVFQFMGYLPYSVPVEIKKKSSGFRYQQKRYSKEVLSRAVVLCVQHDLVNTPPTLDVVELTAFCA
jgi:hypothetical protein